MFPTVLDLVSKLLCSKRDGDTKRVGYQFSSLIIRKIVLNQAWTVLTGWMRKATDVIPGVEDHSVTDWIPTVLETSTGLTWKCWCDSWCGWSCSNCWNSDITGRSRMQSEAGEQPNPQIEQIWCMCYCNQELIFDESQNFLCFDCGHTALNRVWLCASLIVGWLYVPEPRKRLYVPEPEFFWSYHWIVSPWTMFFWSFRIELKVSWKDKAGLRFRIAKFTWNLERECFSRSKQERLLCNFSLREIEQETKLILN